MAISSIRKWLCVLVGMTANIISIGTLVQQFRDFTAFKPVLLLSGDISRIINAFTINVFFNSLCMVVAIGYLFHISGCFIGKSKWPIAILTLLAIIIIAGHIISITMAVLYKYTNLPHLNDSMSRAFISRIGISEIVHYVETKFYCCGVNGPEDYHNISPVPNSCCILEDNPALHDYDWFMPLSFDALDYDKCKRLDPYFVHKTGCFPHVKSWIALKVDFLISYNLCALGVMVVILMLVTDVVHLVIHHVVEVMVRGWTLLWKVVYWDVVEDWDQLCRDRCPSALHII